MEEILARAVQVFLALAGGYLIVLWFALVVWTYRDIGSRSQSVVTQIFATLLALLFFIPGALLYLLMRPRTTLDEAFQRSLEEEYLLQDLEETSLCSSCQRQVSDDYILCPHCQANLKQACFSCNQLIKIGWPVCPYCGSDQTEQAIAIRERVEPPEERFLERSSRTFRQISAPSIREIPVSEPALDLDVRPELAAVGTEPEQAIDVMPPATASDDGAPIKLFDRKRTRAKKQKSVAADTPETSNTGTATTSLDDAAIDDSAVISNFVANGNGNGRHVHTDDRSGDLEPNSDETTPETEEVIIKTTTSR